MSSSAYHRAWLANINTKTIRHRTQCTRRRPARRPQVDTGVNKESRLFQLGIQTSMAANNEECNQCSAQVVTKPSSCTFTANSSLEPGGRYPPRRCTSASVLYHWPTLKCKQRSKVWIRRVMRQQCVHKPHGVRFVRVRGDSVRWKSYGAYRYLPASINYFIIFPSTEWRHGRAPGNPL